jgi:hypothetical protein
MGINMIACRIAVRIQAQVCGKVNMNAGNGIQMASSIIGFFRRVLSALMPRNASG